MKKQNSVYADVARDYLKQKGVFRFRLKKISLMSDDEVIRACHWWYTENHCEKEYRAFEEQQILIAE